MHKKGFGNGAPFPNLFCMCGFQPEPAMGEPRRAAPTGLITGSAGGLLRSV